MKFVFIIDICFSFSSYGFLKQKIFNIFILPAFGKRRFLQHFFILCFSHHHHHCMPSLSLSFSWKVPNSERNTVSFSRVFEWKMEIFASLAQLESFPRKAKRRFKNGTYTVGRGLASYWLLTLSQFYYYPIKITSYLLL